jgi:cytochrome P450
MIYTEAVMLETLRFSSIIPLSIFHAATEDVIFLGYAVPKGTAIIANLWAVHHDKELWGTNACNDTNNIFLLVN